MRSDSEEAGFERHYCPVIRGKGERGTARETNSSMQVGMEGVASLVGVR